MRVLVTGANGFVGLALCRQLQQAGHQVVQGVRRTVGMAGESLIGEIDGATAWADAVKGCQVVIHLAARVHVMDDRGGDLLSVYRRANVAGTLNLARQAAAAGVRRFVFVSSIKVNGESTDGRSPFVAQDLPNPVDPYGVSKAEAEQGLREIAKHTGIEVVIIRPPLVYGLGAKANFATMVRWVRIGVPLPLGAIHNQRSLVALDNLLDLIVTCLHHPAAANQTFMVSDGQDLSTTELLRGLAFAMHRPARLLPVPQPLLEGCLYVLGRSSWVPRLCGNLQVDISHTCQTLDWYPPVSVAEGLRRAVSVPDIMG